MGQLTDADLVRRSAGGDTASFIELIDVHKDSLAALIRRLVSDADEARTCCRRLCCRVAENRRHSQS